MTTPSAFKVLPIDKRKRIPMSTIEALAKHIDENFNPEEIILFGSHAYGKPQSWGDVDLLVVMDTPKVEAETSIKIHKSLPRIAFCLDIIVRFREMIERRKKLGDWFLIDLTEKGKVFLI